MKYKVHIDLALQQATKNFVVQSGIFAFSSLGIQSTNQELEPTGMDKKFCSF